MLKDEAEGFEDDDSASVVEEGSVAGRIHKEYGEYRGSYGESYGESWSSPSFFDASGGAPSSDGVFLLASKYAEMKEMRAE